MPQPDSRRLVLAAAAGTALTGVLGVVGASAAEASTTHTVKLFRALAYRYDVSRHHTTVTRSRLERVVVRGSGRSYSQRNGTGVWVRIPYVWSAAKQGLVYDRYLHLQLIAAARPKPLPPTVPPGPASTNAYLSNDQALHLLRRSAYGPTSAGLAEVHRLGVAGWVDRQLAPSTIDDTACEAVIAARFPHQSKPIWQVHDLLDTGGYSGWQQQIDVCGAQITRAVWSERRLLAVMEDFWSNHFNVTCPQDGTAATRADYARVLRAGAFGKFADLLAAVIQHPAMLVYLNNDISTWQHPNENLGRELLELHSVGLGAGYSEADVLTSARILTGLSVSSDSGEFAWKPWRHWVGPVRLLGFSDPNPTQAGGQAVAQRYLAALARHPYTALSVVTKLAKRFVADSPPQSLIDDLYAVYLQQDTAIAPVLKALFGSPEFAASIGRKTRRPYEHLVATVRTLDLRPDPDGGTGGIFSLYWMAESAGNAPLGWSLPNGYPDSTGAWATTGSTVSRWNLTMQLSAGWSAGDLARPDLRSFLFGSTLPATHGALVDAAAQRLLHRTLLPAHRAALLVFIEQTPDAPVGGTSSALTWRLPYWVAALLGTPYHLYA